MTTELLLYLCICALAFFYVFLNKRLIWVVISYALCAIFMWQVRHIGFDVDMNTYAEVLHYQLGFNSESIYFAREFVYWFGASYLFQIIGDEANTFWVIDLLWLFLMHYALYVNKSNLNFPVFSIPFLVAFFPSLMGYENVYRQLIACMVIIFAFFGSRHLTVSVIVAIFALFIHNSAVVYFPLLYLFNVSRGFDGRYIKDIHKIVFCFSYIVVLAGVYYAALGDSGLSKSSSESTSGSAILVGYIGIFLAMIFVALYASSFRINFFLRKHFHLVYSLLTFLLITPLLGTAQASRIGMMLLIICAPLFTAKLDEAVRDDNTKIILRMLFLLAGIAPTFLFSSAFNFLLTLPSH